MAKLKLSNSNSSPPTFSLKMFYVVTGVYMSRKRPSYMTVR